MNRKTDTRRLTFCSMITALGVVLMLLASVLSGARLALTAVAGVTAALVIVRYGVGYGLVTVAATGLLSLLLVPAKEIALLYLCFFGPYTIVKNLIERLRSLPLEWALKLAFCVVVSALLFLFVSQVMAMVPEFLSGSLLLFLPAVAVVFAAYDIVFSKLISYFTRHIRL